MAIKTAGGKWTKWAASLLVLFTASSALAGSVTQPGDTMGSPSGAPVPPGLYAVNQANWGYSDTSPGTSVLTEIPLLAWSMPWTIISGGRPVLVAAPGTLVNVDIHNTHNATGVFNPFVGGELAWDLGRGWGVSYVLGVYIDINDSVAYSSSSLNQRLGLSYTGDGWDLSANTIWGLQLDQATSNPQGFPCPANPTMGCNPNFLNVDLTGTKKFGKWEVGPIGFFATDLSTPIPEYRWQRKAAVGALAGYWFGPLILQLYVTTEVYEDNYGGKDTRLWSRLVVPLGNPPPPPGLQPIAY